jgi:hypothetical protein
LSISQCWCRSSCFRYLSTADFAFTPDAFSQVDFCGKYPFQYQINPEYFRETATTVYNPEQRSLATNALTSNGPANSNVVLKMPIHS